MENPKKQREVWLDVAKGIATLLVVFGHIMDGYHGSNIFPAYNQFFLVAYNVIYSFHMPLFFILSGYAFSLAYIRIENGKYEIDGKKIKRQIANMATLYILWSIIQWGVKFAFNGDVNTPAKITDLIMLPITAMSPYWYFYVLILLYFASYLFLNKRKPRLQSFMIISFIFPTLYYFLPEEAQTTFTALRFFAYVPFFLIGIFIQENQSFAKKLKSPTIRIALPLLSLTMLAYQCIAYLDGATWPQTSLICTAVAAIISLSVVGLAQSIKSKALATIGKYSLEIYVIHCFITALNRILLIKLGITNICLNIAINAAMAILIPIAIGAITNKTKIGDIFFRPAKLVKKDQTYLTK